MLQTSFLLQRPKQLQKAMRCLTHCVAFPKSNISTQFYFTTNKILHNYRPLVNRPLCSLMRNAQLDKAQENARSTLFLRFYSHSKQLKLMNVSNAVGHALHYQNCSFHSTRGPLSNQESSKGPNMLESDNIRVRLRRRTLMSAGWLLVIAACVYLWLSFDSFVYKYNSRSLTPEKVEVKFKDFGGADEVKEELREIVEYFSNPEKCTRLGAQVPKGVLLIGATGTGKRLLARAVAGEAGVPFYAVSGSDFEGLFLDIGARRLRRLFDIVQARAPCVLFIDDIGLIGQKKGTKGNHVFVPQTFMELLAQLDRLKPNSGVLVLAATSKKEDLDNDLLKVGRFDLQVRLRMPSYPDRKDIFEVYLSKISCDRTTLSIEKLAAATRGFCGSEIESIVNQAALRASSLGEPLVTLNHFSFLLDRMLYGAARKRTVDQAINVNVAWHEAGHAIVGYYARERLRAMGASESELPEPIYKITIVSHGFRLGHTAYFSEQEMQLGTRAQFQAMLERKMAGRAAEDLIFGRERSTAGAESDLADATKMAEDMVRLLGMSEKVGFRSQNSGNAETDQEVKRMLDVAYWNARKILQEHSKEHAALVEALLKYETLSGEEAVAIIQKAAAEAKNSPNIEQTNETDETQCCCSNCSMKTS